MYKQHSELVKTDTIPWVFLTRKMSNNPLSAASENNEIAKWECPYCNQTRQSLPEIRNHITESPEGNHRGIDGLKPTRDLVAYGTDGEEVKRVEGVSTEPADPLEEYNKGEIIINAWLASDKNPDREAIEAISGSSQQYVNQLLNDLESGEIRHEAYIGVLDYGLKDELEERLENYEPEEDTEDTISTQTTGNMEKVIEESSKKDRIIAAHRIGQSADKNVVADALDVSYEYVRQIFNDIENRNPPEWKKLRDGDLNEDPAPELRNAVEQRLLDTGALADSNEEQESQETISRDQVEGMVAAEDISNVREKVELLLEQAEHTGHADAEFATQKTIEWLDELLEKAE